MRGRLWSVPSPHHFALGVVGARSSRSRSGRGRWIGSGNFGDHDADDRKVSDYFEMHGDGNITGAFFFRLQLLPFKPGLTFLT